MVILTLGELFWSDCDDGISGLVSGSVAAFMFLKDWLASELVALFGSGDKKRSFLELNPAVAVFTGGGSATFSGDAGITGSA